MARKAGFLLLSMGIGMFSRSPALSDPPTRSAVCSDGLWLWIFARFVRDASQRWKVIVGPTGLGIVTTAVADPSLTVRRRETCDAVRSNQRAGYRAIVVTDDGRRTTDDGRRAARLETVYGSAR